MKSCQNISLTLGCCLMLLTPGLLYAQGAQLKTVTEEQQQANAETRQRTIDALNTVVDLEGKTTLGVLMHKISESFQITVTLDSNLADPFGRVSEVTEETPVAFYIKGMKLHHALRRALQPLGMNYVVAENGELLVTPELLATAQLETRTFDITQFVPAQGEEESLVHLPGKGTISNFHIDLLITAIKSNVSPASWITQGGTVSWVRAKDGSFFLVVKQTFAIQQELHEFMEHLTEVMGDAEDLQRPTAIDDKPIVQIYPLNETILTGVQAIELLQIALEDVDWEGEEVFVKTVGNHLVIKQTAELHHRIQTILQDLNALRSPIPKAPVLPVENPGLRSVIPVVG
jgi:hypothetical protein